ncbi:hypothetical protein JVU11DRAFT_5142 [Chiua virens]|nr:hypothetical protein JVU11DRAFT_5142 [Chiua virens]
MANTDAKESGIYVWMASVRDSMANDPCRQIFEDQVQSHAFTFLDDYLESILAGPQQGPIIELVKTPARKKNVPRRTRAATAAATAVKNTMFLSLDSVNSTKEVPINSFHKALLQAKERSAQDALNPQKPSVRSLSVSNDSQETIHGCSMSAQLEDFPEATAESRADGILPQQYHGDPPSKSSIPRQASERSTELSVIAEGDESPERGATNPSRLSTVDSNQGEPPHAIPPFVRVTEEYLVIDGNPKVIETDHQSQTDLSPDTPYSVDVYHSIPLDSPQEVQSSEAGNHTEPLPLRTETNSSRNRERNAFTAPLPVVPALNLAQIPDTIYVPLNDSSPRSLAHKNGTAGFPTLPAPSPLRKSLRVAQDVLAGSALPTTAPAPIPLGKRTSWLMKAREAKAMEGTNLLPVVATAPTPIAFPRASTAVKRKSGDMISGLPPGLDWDKDQRKPKIAKSTEVGIIPPKETENDSQRDFASLQGEPIARSSVAAAMPVDHFESHRMDVDQEITRLDSAEEGFIDLFKRTVEGLGARAGKSMGKSLGGAAAAALAEARAAAEAKVAKRNKVSDSDEHRDDDQFDQESLKTGGQSDEQAPFVPLPQTAEAERRLSISDLVPETIHCKEPEVLIQTGAIPVINSGDQSMSTTPPASPPSKGNSGFVKPMGPVFNKPPPQPVFMPPASKQPSAVSAQPKEFPFNLPPGKFTLPATVSLDIPARLTSTSDDPPLAQQTLQTSGQPLQSSVLSDPILHRREGALTPSTLYIKSRTSEERSTVGVVGDDDDDDDDDSWPLEEKLAAVEPGWRPFDFSNVDKEDTWSSLPTESQGTTRNLTTEKSRVTVALPMDTDTKAVPNNGGLEREQQTVETSDVSAMETSEAEEVAEAGTGNRSRAEFTAMIRSQASLASAASSQPQVGFFSQATKLVNSMLGGGKKAKPELKSLQLAAAAAKKQQEEADKKTQRLKDMESRRQVVIAKKAEEERTRLHEEEKKSEIEKRKREREENTDRRPLKPPVSTKKAEDDASKKRKLAPETEKRPESKKLPSKDKKDLPPPAKPSATPATKLVARKGAKAATTVLVSSAAYNSTQNTTAALSAKSIIPEAKPFKVVPSTLKGKAKAKQEEDMGDQLPSTVIQSQMAARAKAQMQTAKLPIPEVPSESIELPEINSEYSDSEDEDRVHTFDPPDWAQSPELHTALQRQSTVNPDDIFGAIRPLRMDEIFRTRQSRFRARTSSANWSGTDRLTVEEIREYERRMGFQQNRAS